MSIAEATFPNPPGQKTAKNQRFLATAYDGGLSILGAKFKACKGQFFAEIGCT